MNWKRHDYEDIPGTYVFDGKTAHASYPLNKLFYSFNEEENRRAFAEDPAAYADKFGVDEELECAVTPGMPSFIFTRTELKEFAEKTIRWPGHFDGVDTLKECGLLDLGPVGFAGQKIVPREFLLSMITPRLRPEEGETDVCVMWNSVVGKKDGKKTRIDHYMWDVADTELGFSSMQRVTGFPCAIAARLIARGAIEEKGIVPPEDCIKGDVYEEFLAELNKRNINVLEEFGEVEG